MVHLMRIIVALCLFSCDSAKIAVKKPEAAFLVETEIVKPRPKFVIERRYIGTIRADKFSLLTPKASGTVATIDIKPGSLVKKGQLLLSLTSTIEGMSVELAEKSLQLAQEKLARIRKLYASHDITKTQLDDAEAAVLTAKAKLAEQKQLQENVELRSPFDGVVGVPRVSLGESVQPQTSIISVIEGPFSVVINIPASRLNEVKVGQPVKFKSTSSTIAAVERSIDPVTRTGFVTVLLPTCNDCIVGDSVYATIGVYEKDNVLLINRNAIFYKNRKPHVVVVTKDEGESRHAEIREIVVGEEQEGEVEVVSGLKSNDEIVIANPKRIQDKAKLTVTQ